LLELIIAIAILVIDQVSKYLTEIYIPFGTSIPLFDGVFQLSNVHNTGAAWGILAGWQWLFLVITPIVCAFLIWILVARRGEIKLLGRICIVLLVSGAIGNLIDRVAFSYVRDMLDFCLINFPVFNVADSAITVGAILLCIDTLFVKKGSIFGVIDTIKLPSKKTAEQETQADA